jgi:tetratricopeptide (TPR) repeat protein
MSPPPSKPTPKKFFFKPPVNLGLMNESERLFQQGLVLLNQGNLQLARENFEKVVKINHQQFDAFNLLGIIAAQLKEFELAKSLFDEAIKINPNNATFYCNQANVYKELKHLEKAIYAYDKAITLNKNYVLAYLNRSIALCELKQYDEALKSSEQAINIKLDYAEAYYQHAVNLEELKRFEESLASYEKAIQLKLDFAEAYSGRGSVLNELNRYEDSLRSCDKAIELNYKYFEAYYNRGNVLYKLKRFEESLASYDKAIVLKPNDAETHYNRGIVLNELERFEESLASYDKAIEFQPEFAEAYSNRGAVLNELKQFDSALIDFYKAIDLNANASEAYLNRGNTFREMMRFEEALDSYAKAILLNPNYFQSYCNRGIILSEFKLFEQALTSYEIAIALNPDYAEAYYNKSLCLLLTGNLIMGWELYEWRWRIKNQLSKKLETKIPTWDGKVTNRQTRILFWAEQGVGDEIFYLGMFGNFANIDARITFAADIRLHALFKRSMPEVEFIDSKEIANLLDENIFELQAPIGDMGLLCSVDKLIKHRSPKQFLNTNNSRCSDFKNNNPFLSGKFICGLSWKSANQTIGVSKSLDLIELSPLLLIEGVEFVSLQYGSTKDEINFVEKKIGKKIHTIEELDIYNDIDGLVSLISECDFVVTTSNITAHLTGAIAKKGIVLLPFSKGKIWYWHSGVGQSIWYPSLDLVSQAQVNDWTDPINKCKEWVLGQI